MLTINKKILKIIFKLGENVCLLNIKREDTKVSCLGYFCNYKLTNETSEEVCAFFCKLLGYFCIWKLLILLEKKNIHELTRSIL